MTLVKFNQRPSERRINTIFDDFFNDFPLRIQDEFSNMNGSVPVNIRETGNAFYIDVIAPGMEKADFKVNVDNNMLTISGEKKAESVHEGERMVRREFSHKSFTRSFTLDDSIKVDKIKAQYDNGILHVEVPRKEEVKIQPKEISIQ